MSKVVLSPDLSPGIKSCFESKIVVTNPVISVQRYVLCSQVISVQRSRKVQVVLQSSLTVECNGNVTPLSPNVYSWSRFVVQSYMFTHSQVLFIEYVER